MGKKHALLLLLLLLLLQVNPGNCRYIAPKYSSSGLVSNGGGEVQQPAFVVFEHRPSPYSCKQTHGVMPCTTTVFGNVFLILVYGYLMFFAARLLYDGSEILVELLSPGITGGVFLPLLSSLPDAIIILGSAASIDIRASYTARIMVISVMPFIIIQLSQVLHTTSQICLAVLISLIISISLLLAYCLHQPTNEGNELLGIQFYTAVKIENPKWSAFKGVFILLLGTLIAATFVDPLVNAVGNFYSATNIPPFFVSFIVLPFASSSEAVSALIFASQKKLRIVPVTVSEIYGAVNMNNLLCLSVFLGLLYFRHLTWNFTSEATMTRVVIYIGHISLSSWGQSPGMAMKHELFFLAMLLLMMVSPGSCGRVAANNSSSSGLVSDGDGEVQQPAFIVFEEWASSYSCYQTYGFMPCTATVPGNILLILVYVSLMLFAVKLLYDGSAILVELLSPGNAGAVFLPLLSSLLDAIINIGSAVSTDIRASYTARIMVISVMPFIIVQLAQVLHTSSQICFAIFISLIIFVSLLLAYCLHQVFHPSILRRKLAYAKQKHMTSRIVKQLKYSPLERLLTTNGEPDMEVIRMLVFMIGGNSDQLLSTSEIRALITGIQIKDKDSDIDDTVGDIMRDVDDCGDSKINIEAFTQGISKWLNKAKNSAVCSSYNHMKTRLLVDHFNLVCQCHVILEHEQLGIQSDEVVKIESPKWSACKAVVMLLLGSLIAATFAGPLVNAVGKFSTATNIPSFFVSFLVLPFASFSEAVSAQIFASQKKLRIASLTFSKIYGAMSMNNFLCMSVFLGLVYFRQLTWNFTSEVLIVLIIWSFLPKEYG
ncbi:hypothetical protein PVL29_015210 [Vitis rotundifolia]|uniref:Sodium/calcium exchanger membrane region domain-containing protein n=1 Tax=Vitis rotundifolia TaxID=103349 RepID=A0AA39DJV2_VITRO|nr:hypothetical protein PVL29_015210 [Vitis rotundifolia]